jgi:hypothetical protein
VRAERLINELLFLGAFLVGWFSGGWMIGCFGRGRWGAIQDVEGWLRHGLAGVGEKETDLPHLGVAELGLEGGHAGEPNAIFDFPIGFADGVVTDSDDARVVVVRLEKLGSVRVHVVAKSGRMAVDSVAGGAAVDVDSGAGDQVCGIRLHVSADQLPLNARIQGDVDELALAGKSGVGYGDGNLAVHEVHDDDQGNQDDSDDQAKDEAHSLLRPPQNFIVEHENGSWRQKGVARVQKESVPVRVAWIRFAIINRGARSAS